VAATVIVVIVVVVIVVVVFVFVFINIDGESSSQIAAVLILFKRALFTRRTVSRGRIIERNV